MPRGRRGRGRGGRILSTTRTSTPTQKSSDDEMPDAPEELTQQSAPEDQPAESPAAEATEAASPEKQPQGGDDGGTPASFQVLPRRRRLGRPPKNRPPDWDSPRPAGEEGAGGSEQGTPFRRKRGRPPGFRGRARGQSYQPSKVRIDKEGNMADVVEDEIVLPDDPEGEEKVDKNGNLLGGREYRVRTFTIMNRGKKLFMLSTEPARCCGFRDSYLFFTKHMSLHKVIVEEDEKRDLIDREVIPHSYKGRAIGVVTARSVFREFGARIVVGGKKVMDDYWAQAARDRGDVEGEIADPNDRLPPDGQPYNRNQYVAWHGASAVYHTNLPAIPITNGKPLPPKRRVQITSANWQFEHARAASNFNSTLVAQRKACWNGVYDAHTNAMHYPRITQPTHVRWEPVLDEEPGENALPNGDDAAAADDAKPSVFGKVPTVVARNFMVTDTVFEAPPLNGAGLPGVDGPTLDVGAAGLPNPTPELLELLPEECRAALLREKEREAEWKAKWTSEAVDGMRGQLRIAFLGWPQ